MRKANPTTTLLSIALPLAVVLSLPSPANAKSASEESSKGRIEAPSKSPDQKPGSKKKVMVLDPEKVFSPQVKAGYIAAGKIPEICAKLFCYCGCDLTECHGSLLDCFTNEHGVDCVICQEEAILALKYHRKGKSLSKIQKYIDKRFQKRYPFEIESETLIKYRQDRLWDKKKKKRQRQSK